jgi:hypothetical protein
MSAAGLGLANTWHLAPAFLQLPVRALVLLDRVHESFDLLLGNRQGNFHCVAIGFHV